MYRLLAVDMDGTLLNDESKITSRTKEALHAALSKGVLFVVSTGRPVCALKEINELFKEDLPFIVFNGAMAVTAKTKRVLFSKNLDPEYAEEIFREGLSLGMDVVLWADNELYISGDNAVTRDYQKISGAPFKVIEGTKGLNNINKIIWITSPENVKKYQSIMGERYKGQINCHASRSTFLEFVDEGASKGAALQEIGRVYGIGKDEMIAIGDGYNDLSMLKFAGLGVAMANAPDDIKAACDIVTSSNNDDGVAKVIENYILKGWS